MKLVFKVFGTAVISAAIFFLTFALWGDMMETWFSHRACAEWFSNARRIGWLAGIVLLISDLFIPIPATGVMSALGDVYGFWGGWMFGAIGSISAGLLGYGLVRACRERIAHWLASPEDLQRFQHTFDRWGGGAIIVSRIVPILSEVMCVLAGLARMRFIYFASALALGTLPVTGLFSWWGHFGGNTAPAATHTTAIILPLLLWPIILMVLKRLEKGVPEQAHTIPQ